MIKEIKASGYMTGEIPFLNRIKILFSRKHTQMHFNNATLQFHVLDGKGEKD